jgi:hypothetical protein
MVYIAETREKVRERIGRLIYGPRFLKDVVASVGANYVTALKASRFPTDHYSGDVFYVVDGPSLGTTTYVSSSEPATAKLFLSPVPALMPSVGNKIEVWPGETTPDDVNGAIDLALLEVQHLTAVIAVQTSPTIDSAGQADHHPRHLEHGRAPDLRGRGVKYMLRPRDPRDQMPWDQSLPDHLRHRGPNRQIVVFGTIPATATNVRLVGYAMPALPTADTDLLTLRSDYRGLQGRVHPGPGRDGHPRAGPRGSGRRRASGRTRPRPRSGRWSGRRWPTPPASKRWSRWPQIGRMLARSSSAGCASRSRGRSGIANITVPPNPVSFGDATKKGDTQAMSTQIQSSNAGGARIYRANSNTDTDRWWDSTCQTEVQEALALPIKTYSMGKPAGLTTEPVSLIFPHRNEEHFAFSNKVYRWLDATQQWSALDRTLSTNPTDWAAFNGAVYVAYGSGYDIKDSAGTWSTVARPPPSSRSGTRSSGDWRRSAASGPSSACQPAGPGARPWAPSPRTSRPPS